jgi:cellulose synthase/poly-beta-1,6-N-acetylglucosamine synthase-like glycosyltransferase
MARVMPAFRPPRADPVPAAGLPKHMMAFSQLGLLFAAQEQPGRTLWRRLTDPALDPFTGIYQLNAFDLAMMIPYFLVLIVLAAYGIHRYQLVYYFLKYRHNAPQQPPPPAEWPTVTVQLPIYNERYVVERLVESIAQFDYPRDRLEVQVLDDSTDETRDVARNVVERYQALGFPVTYHHRANRDGYKAGALDKGMKTARGQFIAIFDADFQPPADWLKRVVPFFAEPQVGMVQTRWTYINRDYSALTEVEGILLDGHFIIEHGGRSRRGVFFNFNGTAGMWRRRAIEEAGGWEHDTLTEDTDLSYRAQMKGWRFVYVPEIECPSELPVEMNAFKAQQARWAKGLIQVAKKILPRLLRSEQPFVVKAEAVFHLTANISYPLMILLSTLLLPAMIVRFYQGWFQMLVIDLPLFLASTFSISTFYLTAQRELYPRTWPRTFLYLPWVMACGIGLAVRNSIAVLEALRGKQSEFVRTPKYAVGQARSLSASRPADVVAPIAEPVRVAVAAASATAAVGQALSLSAQPMAAEVSPMAVASAANGPAPVAAGSSSADGSWLTKAYRRSAGWTPYAEILLGLYFAATVVYAVQNENYATVPFLLLFVGGYLYTGLMSLGQVYLERLRFGLKAPVEARPAATGAPSF